MKPITKIIALLFLILCFACEQKENPAAPGFNEAESDQKAIEIADQVMEAMGGRKAWDQSRYFYWDFFDARSLLWDKKTGDVRIRSHKDSLLYLFNLNTLEGKVYDNGEQIQDAEKVKEALENAKGMWINDSYWLFMPFKLKDSGVTLNYIGEESIGNDNKAYVLQLTFENVGNTPNNKYRIYVDQSDMLVKQWAYYKSSEQDSATAIWPWDNYDTYLHGLKLSSDRSDDRGPKNVQVLEEVPDGIFSDPEVTFEKL